MPSISKDARVKAKTTSILGISQHPMLVAVRTSHGSDSSMVSTKKMPFAGSSQKKIFRKSFFIVLVSLRLQHEKRNETIESPNRLFLALINLI